MDIENTEIQEMDMAQLLAEHESAAKAKSVDLGSILMAKVISISEDGLWVDTGEKKEAFIPSNEFKKNNFFSPGDTIPVILSTKSGKMGSQTHVSWRKAAEQMAWEHITQSKNRNLPVTVKVIGDIKGGLLLECEDVLTAFMPASHVDIRPVKDLKSFKNKTFTASIVESEPHKGKLILSRKIVLSQENQKKKEEILSRLKDGEVHTGVVTGITSFGAFVDLGGVEGLLHIGELEWARTRKVSDVVKVGQEITVKIIKFDLESEKISLSRKTLLPHPWDNIESRFPIDSQVSGKITSVTDFGAFVEIAPQVEGLLHGSEILWGEPNPKPGAHLKVGQTLLLKIIGVDRQKEKISLSLKRNQESPWKRISENYPPGSTVKVKITHLAPYGAFARLPEGFEGLIHISDFSWVKRIPHPNDMVKSGQEIEVKIISVKPDTEKISFGIKQMKPNPFETYRKGFKVSGSITQVTDQGAHLEIEPDLEGYIPLSEVSIERVDSAKKVFKIGDTAEAKVIAVDAKNRRIQLSVRSIEQDQHRQAVKKYSAHLPRPNLGELLDN